MLACPVGAQETPTTAQATPVAASAPLTLSVQSQPYRVASGQPVVLTLTLKDEKGQPVSQWETLRGVTDIAQNIPQNTGQLATNTPGTNGTLGATPTIDPKAPFAARVYAVRLETGEMTWTTLRPNKNGTFTYTGTFANGGTWRVLVEAIPKGQTEPRLAVATLEVEGAKEIAAPLAGRADIRAESGGMILEGRPRNLEANRPVRFLFALTESRRGVNDVGFDNEGFPLAHLLFVSPNGEVILARVRALRTNTPNTGNLPSFTATFPKPGTYRAYLFAQRQNRQIPAIFNFALRVQ